MTETPKEYHFTDKQIDTILRLVRSAAFDANWGGTWIGDEPYTVLANIIEDQIVNHPTNP
jgi:hypothetical protein